MPVFKTLILIGRPASGKSEFIHAMKQVADAERAARFHIGPLHELDDFLWLWEKFTDDDIWESAGYPRRYSKKSAHGYVVTDGALLDYCFAKFNAEYARITTEHPGTLFIEFARGAGDGGYTHALNRLSDELLRDAAILYIDTSYEESCRRNLARYQEKLKHSILAHKVPDEDMVRFAQHSDWATLTAGAPHGALTIRNIPVPFVTLDNEIELTDGTAFQERCERNLAQLLQLVQTATHGARRLAA